MDADHALLERRRAQAVGSLREVERRQAAGEIDDDEAAELIELFAERAAVATAELEAAGDDPTPRGRERMLPVLVVVGVLLLTVLVVAIVRSDSDSDRGGDAASAAPGEPRDLGDVSNEEMEKVIAENPAIVPMRLALVERYLDDGDLQRAHDHAQEALRHQGSAADRHRAAVYVGWTAALLGRPEDGERVLRAAVEAEPDDLDARWYLANVLADRGDVSGARAMLESILERDIPEAQRSVVEQKLEVIQ